MTMPQVHDRTTTCNSRHGVDAGDASVEAIPTLFRQFTASNDGFRHDHGQAALVILPSDLIAHSTVLAIGVSVARRDGR